MDGPKKAFKAGDTAVISHVITGEDIQKFVQLTGDDNPLHVNREFAGRTSFKDVVVHGMLGASFISTIIGKHIPGEGALWISQNIEFLLPVRIGDRLSIRAEVTDVHEQQRLLTLKTEIFNQHDQKVLNGQAKVKMLDVAPPEKPRQGDGGHLKAVVVTGASRGIGAAVAKELARRGYRVAVNYHVDQAGADAVVKEISDAGGEAFAVKADILDAAAVDEMLDIVSRRFGGISALVNNAAPKMVMRKFAETTDAELRSNMEMYYVAPVRMTRAALGYLEKQDGGAVVNITTVNADNVPAPQMLSYTAAKAALANATKSLAVEYGPKGIRFNIVSPGMTDSAFIADLPEKARLITKMQTPLRQLARPEDIANAAAFLLDDASRHITGETLRVCGGLLML